MKYPETCGDGNHIYWSKKKEEDLICMCRKYVFKIDGDIIENHEATA